MTIIEPSDAERATWPQATAEYVAALEGQADELQAENAGHRAEIEDLCARLDVALQHLQQGLN